MATNQSQYEEMCEVYERYNKGDLVLVVRCKDCVYWGTKAVYANGERADCLNFNFVTPCEFFCKWGEKEKRYG